MCQHCYPLLPAGDRPPAAIVCPNRPISCRSSERQRRAHCPAAQLPVFPPRVSPGLSNKPFRASFRISFATLLAPPLQRLPSPPLFWTWTSSGLCLGAPFGRCGRKLLARVVELPALFMRHGVATWSRLYLGSASGFCQVLFGRIRHPRTLLNPASTLNTT